VQIPMRGSVESLNVSVAAVVCLLEAVRQRHGGIVEGTAGAHTPARRGAPGML
jgi:hypothetical protein